MQVKFLFCAKKCLQKNIIILSFFDHTITASEEFDPEEREAFVDDVYADDHLHLNRRNDDTNQDEDDTNTEDDQQADLIDKKR